MKKLAFTGHRPDKLGSGSYDIKDHVDLCRKIREECIRHIKQYDVSVFIQGLALGVDQWMINNCTYLIGVHDGSEGGTGNCVKYARKKLKEENITIIDPNKL